MWTRGERVILVACGQCRFHQRSQWAAHYFRQEVRRTERLETRENACNVASPQWCTIVWYTTNWLGITLCSCLSMANPNFTIRSQKSGAIGQTRSHVDSRRTDDISSFLGNAVSIESLNGRPIIFEEACEERSDLKHERMCSTSLPLCGVPCSYI